MDTSVSGRLSKRGAAAIGVSVLLHCAILFLGGLSDPIPALTEVATAALVEIAIPGAGHAGAPVGARLDDGTSSGSAATGGIPSAVRERSAASRVLTAARSADSLPLADERSESTDGDAFIDSLLAGSVGGGGGAGGGRAGGGGVACADPIAGTWRARRYSHDRGQWGVFTLRIGRVGAQRLAGTVHLHAWNGSPDDPSTPVCTPSLYEHEAHMNATGTLSGDRVRFEARDHVLRVLCMDRDNPDRFTGSLRGDRMFAVNNDGGVEVNTPYTFRRIACE